MAKKTGRPAFRKPYHTLNVYFPQADYDRLGAQAHRLKCSRSALIRAYVASCLDDAEVDAAVAAKQAKVLRA